MTKSRELSDHPNKPVTKNAIINGNFDIWQRDVSLPSGNGGRYLADRWLNLAVGTTHTTTRELFVDGQTDVPNNPKYFHRVNVTSVANPANVCVLTQRIEDVNTFSNEHITISFWAKADSPKNIATSLNKFFGPAGSPDENGLGVKTHALTTSWQKFTSTFLVSSTSGKTITTDHYIQPHWWFDAGSNFDSRNNSLGQQSGIFDIAQVQIEKGHIPTDFETRHIGFELFLCQRYYEKSYDIDVVPGTPTVLGENGVTSGAAPSGGATATVQFQVEKRINPTTTIYNPATGAAGQMNRATFGAISATIGAQGTHSALAFNNVAGSDSTQHVWHWVAEAEL